MFCEMCGKKLEDGGNFCPYCGASCNAQDTPQEAGTYNASDWQGGQGTVIRRKRRYPYLIGAAAIVLVIMFAVSFWGDRGYKKPIELYLEYMQDYMKKDELTERDGERFIDLFIPKQYVGQYLSEQNLTMEEAAEKVLDLFAYYKRASNLKIDLGRIEGDTDEENQTLEETNLKGNDPEVRYKIKETENLKGDELEDVIYDCEMQWNVNLDDDMKGKKVNVEITVKENGDESTGNLTFTVLKIEKKWYLVNMQ